jgi:deazaflavin-dependent oxidoreductase (nitroreductase family)
MARRARLMKLANHPMRWLLRLPFPTPISRNLMLVTHVGRRTGRTYRQPVSYVRDGDTLLTPGGGRWTRNLQDGKPVEVRLAGHRVTARAERVRDPEEVERLLLTMFKAKPAIARFVPFVSDDGTVDRDALNRAVEHGFCIVRWTVEP